MYLYNWIVGGNKLIRQLSDWQHSSSDQAVPTRAWRHQIISVPYAELTIIVLTSLSSRQRWADLVKKQVGGGCSDECVIVRAGDEGC